MPLINRRVAVLALLALATPAVASASHASHPAGCPTINTHDEDGFGNGSVVPVVPVTTGDIVLLNGFARDTEREATSARRAQCDAQHGSGYGDDSVRPLLPITTGDIVVGNGFFEGDIENFYNDGFFGDDEDDD